MDRMSGFWTQNEYAGKMPDGRWMKFSTEKEYVEAYLEMEKNLKEILENVLTNEVDVC